MVDFAKHLRQPLPASADLALPKLGDATSPLCTVRTVQESTNEAVSQPSRPVTSQPPAVVPDAPVWARGLGDAAEPTGAVHSVDRDSATSAVSDVQPGDTPDLQGVKVARPCTWCYGHGGDNGVACPDCGAVCESRSPDGDGQSHAQRCSGESEAQRTLGESTGTEGGAIARNGALLEGCRVNATAAAGSEPADSPALWPNPCPPFTFLAGAAGSGKTFALKEWAAREKGLVLTASTGIASVNLGEGQTINSLLEFFDTRSLQESYVTGFLTARLGRLWKSGIRRILLDEVSMVSGDQLTYIVKAIEEVNGRGYVLGKWDAEDETEPPAMGLTLCGDMCQLAPVKEPYAFESPEWHRFAAHTKTLTEIRRQADPAFIQALRQARVGNGRAVLDYFAWRLQADTDDAFEGPTLLAKNEAVDRYNWLRLSKVSGADLYFESAREGKQRSEWGDPKKPPASWGVPLRLHLKVGALVMVLANRRAEGPPPQPYHYVNGDLGEVIGGDETACLVKLQRTGMEQWVEFVRREVLQPCDAARRKELRAAGKVDCISENGKFEIIGWISYMPLRVAYASTVHKSQGLSLDRVQVNIRDSFFRTPGMLYVALSRARTAEGLRLVGSEAALVERCTADPRLKEWL